MKRIGVRGITQPIVYSLDFHSLDPLRENPFGQNDNCNDEVMLDCLVGAITGKFQVSYWTEVERLKLE